jgi:predicted PurR-regulated permease PerM
MKPLSLEAFRSQIFQRIASLLWVIVVALVITFCYFASSFCITLVLASFLSILVDPIVTFFEKWKIPRPLSSALLIIIGMLAIVFLGYSSYNRFTVFVGKFPAYADRVRNIVKPLNTQIAKLEDTAGKLNPETGKRVAEVKLKETPAWPSYLVRGFGSASNGIVILGVVPFLLFFLLIRKEKWYQNLVQILGPNNDPENFSAKLAEMVRRFALGNFAVGVVVAAATAGVLFGLKIQGAIILGVISGFLNLIPFLGVLLAVLVPMAVGLVQGSPVSTLLIIAGAVVALHIVTLNFIIPRMIGSRINIGPVAATAGILFWGWLWGVVGVLLAIPLTGTVKMIADCHPSLKNLSDILGETPSSTIEESMLEVSKEIALPKTAPQNVVE